MLLELSNVYLKLYIKVKISNDRSVFKLDEMESYSLSLSMYLINYLKSLGFNFYVISNNHKKRVSRFCDPLGIKYLWRAGKPGVLKVSLFMKKHKLFHDETVIIGDQIMTDVILANKLDIKSVLVEPVADQDLIVTKINRSFDHKIRKKLRLDGKLKGVE